MDSVITSKLGNSWPKYAAYLLVAGVILTFISLSIKKLVDSDDEEQKKFGKQLGISVGVLGIIVMLIVGYTSMSDDKRSVINFLLEFFPYILLLGTIAGLFYLVFPDNNITEDLKDVQKRMGIVAGVGTVAVAITALLTSSMLRTDPGPTFFPFTMTMIFVNLQIALLSFLSVFYGKV